MPRGQDQLQSLKQLNILPTVTPKACAIGIIIDATNAYFDDGKQRYVKKIKIIDETLNPTLFDPNQKTNYLTAFFYSTKLEELPNPKNIGDLIYLRRFSFGKYNNGFQAHSNSLHYCSWALLQGQSDTLGADQYETSRIDMNLNDEKYGNLLSQIQGLRKFARSFFLENSILSILPSGVKVKDEDMIVQVVRKGEDTTKLIANKKEITLKNIPHFVQEGSIAKLRSVVRLENKDGVLTAIPNNFTSLITIPDWYYDAKKFHKQHKNKEIQNEEIFTSLAELNTIPLKQCQNKTYFIKVQVAHISADKFESAIKYYDQKKNALYAEPRKDTVPIYNIALTCLDQSSNKNHKFTDIWIFSFDGKGSDFVKRVDLLYLSQFSTLYEENVYYTRRYEELLNADYVKMTVEVLSDGKNGRLLRAVSVE